MGATAGDREEDTHLAVRLHSRHLEQQDGQRSSGGVVWRSKMGRGVTEGKAGGADAEESRRRRRDASLEPGRSRWGRKKVIFNDKWTHIVEKILGMRFSYSVGDEVFQSP